ncbi:MULTISPECIES: RNA polymerase sigma factor [unclassified Colwellia]|uniref:RNA polymerase sigma factor n=1 Tax=unclassified Colwellia TaxID=196834 RepID=UPI0015F545AC|nr:MULTISPECIES: sigma-70 family RNA polymerase sigma factor [unclassified Colwellia]MBA6230758.1 sigma-70 family RNA polymerase sigma factor [Colwellia sp. MB02u-7]MBA6234689.1 sigma-70 family RNA polymerase sigma factor [Colwellia sp. MB02u-11]MBA6301243.1 sigma-70 family RNA polymerase sigma factor [Colwellia sp. MB3u-22]MBA6313021.1 sigma-70 family RNA polymerase sigma factor [Colwellia sp. MB3u-64]
MFERSDETLVKQALKGKKSAWVALVKRYEKNLYNYTLRMVSHPADAMDLMQDVFVAVFRNLSTFRGDSPFKGWMFKIAHYRCIEFYRRKRPTQSLDDLPEQVDEASDECPEYQAVSGQQAKALHKALQALPLNQKLVVELKFFQHCTFDDIAKQLGISVNTVKSRLYSGLDKLKDHLEFDYV